MAARSSAVEPPVSTWTVCTAQPSSARRGTQKEVSRPPEKASASGPRDDCIMHKYEIFWRARKPTPDRSQGWTARPPARRPLRVQARALAGKVPRVARDEVQRAEDN